MKLFWSSRSPFARKVMVAAHEGGLADAIERIPVAIPTPEPHAELNRANPIAKLPTLVTDDGLVIAGSPVICEYLDGLGQAGLFPADRPARWRALSRQAMADGMLDMLLLWRADLRRPDACQSPRQQAIYRTRLAQTLDRFDAEATSDHGFDIGDLTTGVFLSYLDFRFADDDWRDGRPALRHTYECFAARPSAQATGFDG
ncbi:glutathione S-transferase family protein [Hephaestia sp. GCM10023244]|uniref:glutathione S-transferase family protein n=1 Tax=unclassified Hephaestia TaxID=2631281 RepID=UPI0020775EBB|nr:glutathione S-transferase N-terminal domain-containing protein [Hephaestia sp. MAHUQ-44]MCM8732061.1 glutathione S-transferase N-terminal domain-containing protein [Hephaestia sp. MAHUQ-44]